jgi:adenine deaminase
MNISGNIIDIHKRKIYPGTICTEGELISRIVREERGFENYILPGLIDAHIHIESSMCTPGAFAMTAVSRGTTGVVSDPHEIANVLGIDGVKFMIDDAAKVPVKFWFGAPSCVPATSFESSGAVIDSQGLEELLKLPEVKYLAEMMNFPGVIFEDPEVLRKISVAKRSGKPIDGHAPGLSGEDLKKYVKAGISTDHECSTMAEALEKISLGMEILIREGSAARNLDALKDLIATHPDMVMLCSDDLHPEMLGKRHINKVVAKLVSEGYDLFDILRSCTINPAAHYGLDAGLLRPGDPADFIVVDDPRDMNVLETWIDGKKVWDRGQTLFDYTGSEPLNKFYCTGIEKQQITVRRTGEKMRIIEALEGELITREILADFQTGEWVLPDLNRDILKIVVKDRYNNAPPATAFIKGFGLKRGAFASSVAHDSHNIICIGTNDDDIVNSINELVKMQGGLIFTNGNYIISLPLPIAGIMSDKPVFEVASRYEKMSEKVRESGCSLSAPYMTLSFMALLVIPELKLSDRGLFNGKIFQFVPLFI